MESKNGILEPVKLKYEKTKYSKGLSGRRAGRYYSDQRARHIRDYQSLRTRIVARGKQVFGTVRVVLNKLRHRSENNAPRSDSN